MGMLVTAAEAAALVNRHERIVRGRIKRGDLPSAHKDPGGHVWRVDVDDLAAIPGWTLDRERLAALELRQKRTPSGVLAQLQALEAALRVERERRRRLEGRLAALETLIARAVGYAPPAAQAQAEQEAPEGDAVTRSEGADAWAAYDARLAASERASAFLDAAGDDIGGYGSIAVAEYEQHGIGLSPDARNILSEPTPRPRRAALTTRLSSSLPDGLVSWRSFAHLHGIPETTVAKAIDTGRLPSVAGKWKDGRAYVLRALDADGRRTFVALWGDRDDFTRCAECPH